MTSSLEFIFCQYISSIIFIYIKILHLPSVVMETSTNKILWFCSQLVVGAFFVMRTEPIQVLSETELLGHKFTVYGTAENPLFLAKEVAECIEYDQSSVNKLVNLVDDDEKVRNNLPTSVEISKFGSNRRWLI